MQKKLTEGSILKCILMFAFPILIGNGLQRVYILVDTIMVGRLLGTEQLAAVGAASVIANLFIDLCASFTSGFSIIIAQHYGAGDEKSMKKALAATYKLAAALFVILTISGFILIKPFLHLTNAPEEIFPLAKTYLRIMIGGLLCSLIYNMLANILRGVGDSTIPLVFLIISVSLNIFLDYFCIAILKLGVAGAATATIISQGFAGIGCLIFCLKKRRIIIVNLKELKASTSWSIYKPLIMQGLAMALMISVVSLSTLILQTGINSLGTTMIAGYMAGRKYLELLMMPGAALAMTTASFVSQNFGAKLFGRIKKGVNYMFFLGFSWAAISCLIIFIFGRQIITSVTGKNALEEVINCGIQYMRIGVCFFIPLDLLVICRSALQGMNHKKTPIFSSCIELIIKIIAVLLLVPNLGFFGICITEPLIWVINAIWIFPVYIIRIRQYLRQ